MSSTASPDDDRALRSARRTLVLFVVALGAAALGGVLVLVGDRGDDGGSTVADAGSGDDPQTVAVIGPDAGDSVDRYLDRRRPVIDEIEGTVAAVVSLTGYSTVDTVADLVGELELDRYLVAVVGDVPRTSRDVEATVDDVRATAAQQLEEIEQLAPTVEDDPDYSRFYLEEIDRYRRLVAAPPDQAVVFGFVVVGQASELRALASRASVRLVDVGTSARLDPDAQVRGLRPEETATVGEPRVRP